MIAYNPKGWFSLIFKFHKSDTFRQLFWVMVSIAAYTFLVTYAELNYWHDRAFTNEVHALLGFVISLLLVFRTNSAYDKWWEGRKQWGALVNNTRNLGMKINAMLPKEDTQNRELFRVLISNYPKALAEHLRRDVAKDLEECDRFKLSDLDLTDHVPNQIATAIIYHINRLYKEEVITGDQLYVLNAEMQSLTDICGACERILKTPIPYSYNLFLKKFMFLYIMTLPYGFIFKFNYWTIMVVVLVFYVLMSLELIAEEIEEPFGTDANDLPTNEIAETISKNIKTIIAVK